MLVHRDVTARRELTLGFVVALASACGSTAGPEPGVYRLPVREVRLDGLFRTTAEREAAAVEPVETQGTTEHGPTHGLEVPARVVRAEDYWVEPAAIERLARRGDEVWIGPSDVLTALVCIDAEGRVSFEWVGADAGLVAMPLTLSRKDGSVRRYAVEAESEEPWEFVLGGVPEPEDGSLALEFHDVGEDGIARSMTVSVCGEDGSLWIEVTGDGGFRILPGA